ncbi:MAG: lipase family protein [Maribacter sp.]|nr:lipase family protein [Maribacter sp.]
MDEKAIIIGVHGLLNKPEKTILQNWWRDAIVEGISRNFNRAEVISFELAYWADVRNAKPIDYDDLDERYQKANGSEPLERYDDKLMDGVRANMQKWGGKILDKEKDLFGLGKNVEKLLGVTVEDLAEYYDQESVRLAIRSKLIKVIEKYTGYKIILVGHSMGSIVSYDVLRLKEETESFNIEHFITIGSPLGLPLVSKKIREEFGATRTPGNVRHWTNIADPEDKVALDFNLADEFDDLDRIKVKDTLAHNEYENHEGKKNCHKSYGYLRAPEFTDILVNSGIF